MNRNEGIHRHDISGKAWERIKNCCPDRQGSDRGSAKDKRLFISAADAHKGAIDRHIV